MPTFEIESGKPNTTHASMPINILHIRRMAENFVHVSKVTAKTDDIIRLMINNIYHGDRNAVIHLVRDRLFALDGFTVENGAISTALAGAAVDAILPLLRPGVSPVMNEIDETIALLTLYGT